MDQCAQELSYAATHNLSLPEDISTTVSLLQTLVQALVEDEAHSPSLMTSEVYITGVFTCMILFPMMGCVVNGISAKTAS